MSIRRTAHALCVAAARAGEIRESAHDVSAWWAALLRPLGGKIGTLTEAQIHALHHVGPVPTLEALRKEAGR